jgi:hypothetical protein
LTIAQRIDPEHLYIGIEVAESSGPAPEVITPDLGQQA